MIELKKGEKVLFRRKANLVFPGYKKSVGTLFITNLRLSFHPILHKKQIDVHLHFIKKVELIKGIFKKMRVVTEEKEYVIFTKDVENVIHLVKTLMD